MSLSEEKITIIVKQIAYRSIPYHEIRELVVLEQGKKLLQVNDLVVHYPLLAGMLKRQIGAVKAVNGVNFEIKTGETLGLVGESGCGKTTVANAILGIVERTSGEIIFNDEPIPEEYPRDIRRKIQIVFQDPDASLNPRMKVVKISFFLFNEKGCDKNRGNHSNHEKHKPRNVENILKYPNSWIN